MRRSDLASSAASGSAVSVALTLLPHAVFAALVLVSWNRWMEPFVDSGRELMVPWRISQGEALYRDVHFHHGPLAPWAGAAIDAAAGRSIGARTGFAALIALANLEALRRLCVRWIPGPGAAVTASLTVALAFFLRPGGWLFPFSFDVALAVAALTTALALQEEVAGRPLPAGPPVSRGRDLVVAVALLIALLSRLELGLAGIVAIAWNARRGASRLWILGAAPLLAAGAVYGAVSAGVPLERLISDGWLALVRPPQAFRNVYRAYAGLDQPSLRLIQVVLAAVLLVLILCLLTATAAVSQRAARHRRAVEVSGLTLLAAIGILFQFPPAAMEPTLSLFPPLVRSVPPIVVGLLAARVVAIFSRRGGEARPLPAVSDGALLLAAVFALRLLLAAGYSGPYNAFFLPLPVAAAVAIGLGSVTNRTPSLGPVLARLSVAALGIFLVLRGAAVAGLYRSPGWEPLDTPAGRVVLPEVEARTAKAVLDDLRGRLPPGGTLAGFPEAGFFGYTLGTRNPLDSEQFWPGHFDDAGERRVIAALEARPPDALLLINALAVGEGTRAFGSDYSRALGAFVTSRFTSAALYGVNPRSAAAIGDPDFFIEVRVPVRAAAAADRLPRTPPGARP